MKKSGIFVIFLMIILVSTASFQLTARVVDNPQINNSNIIEVNNKPTENTRIIENIFKEIENFFKGRFIIKNKKDILYKTL